MRTDVTPTELLMMAHASAHALYVFDRLGFFLCQGNVDLASDRLANEYENINSACCAQYEKVGEHISEEDEGHLDEARRFLSEFVNPELGAKQPDYDRDAEIDEQFNCALSRTGFNVEGVECPLLFAHLHDDSSIRLGLFAYRVDLKAIRNRFGVFLERAARMDVSAAWNAQSLEESLQRVPIQYRPIFPATPILNRYLWRSDSVWLLGNMMSPAMADNHLSDTEEESYLQRMLELLAAEFLEDPATSADEIVIVDNNFPADHRDGLDSHRTLFLSAFAALREIGEKPVSVSVVDGTQSLMDLVARLKASNRNVFGDALLPPDE